MPGNLFPLKPSNSGNRIFAKKKTMMLNKSLSPGKNNLYTNYQGLNIKVNLSKNNKIFQVERKPPEFERQLRPQVLVVSLEQPILGLINKDGQSHGVGPDVLVPQADQTPAVG